MGAENGLGIFGGKRGNDEHVGSGFRGPGHGPGTGVPFDLFQSVRQGIRVPAELSPGKVSHVFPGTGNGQLDNGRRQRGQHQHQHPGNGVVPPVIPVSPEPEGKPGHDGNDPGHAGGNGADQNVIVLHMAHFVSQDPGHFPGGKHFHEPCSNAHRRMFRIPSGSKGIGQHGIHHIHPGHGQLGPTGQAFHNAVQLGSALSVHRLGPVLGNDQFVTVPVQQHIGNQRKGQHHGHAAAAADIVADQQQETGHQAH